MLRRGLLIALLLVLLASVTGVLAQEAAAADGSPSFGAVTLRGNFVLDPFLITVIGGGVNAASDLNMDCVGFVPADPTLTLTLSGDPTENLRIFAYSDADPVLVVQTPAGDILCNDDTGPLVVDPTITIASAEAGEYTLWLGAYDQNQLTPAFLVFTHSADITATRFDVSSLVQREPAGDVAINLASQLGAGVRTIAGAALSADFDPTAAPQTFDNASGGGGILALETDARGLQCAGYISGEPTLNVTVAADTPLLRVLFESTSDSTLVIVGPNGELFCNDDVDSGNLNPAITIPAPDEGIYAVFVGTFDPAAVNSGRLILSGSAAEAAAVLEAPSSSAGQ